MIGAVAQRQGKGRMVECPVFLPLGGDKQNVPSEFLDELFSPYSRNIETATDELNIGGRLGLQLFDSETLSGSLMFAKELVTADESIFFILGTTKDIYVYDFSNLRFDIITPTYVTGTITIAGGSPTIVTGSGTAWLSNLKAGDFIKIGSGSVHTDSTWYEIFSVDSDTQVTLTSSAATCSGSAYVARKTFSGNFKDRFSVTQFEDSNLGTIFIATNGVNPPVYWAGSGQMSFITTLPGTMTTARYVQAFEDRVFWAFTVEGGANQPTVVRASDPGDALTYDASNFWAFLSDNIWITGMFVLNQNLCVARESDAQIGRYIGGTTLYRFDSEKSFVGTPANESIVLVGNTTYYFGSDLRFHRWNGVQDDAVQGDDFFAYTKNVDPNGRRFVAGVYVEHKKQIRWQFPTDSDYPNAMLVYSLQYDNMNIWEYAVPQALGCVGFFSNVEDRYADDPVYGELYADETEGYADDRLFLSGAKIIVYGGYDGKVRLADVGANDESTAYTRLFRTGMRNFGLPAQEKRLFREQYWFNAQTSGSISLKYRLDHNNDFDATVKTIDISSAAKTVLKKTLTWNKRAENLQLEISGTCHWELIGLFSLISVKRKTY